MKSFRMESPARDHTSRKLNETASEEILPRLLYEVYQHFGLPLVSSIPNSDGALCDPGIPLSVVFVVVLYASVSSAFSR